MGGIGKTTLIKEIDAFEGHLPKIADLSSIHVRTLNTRKGRAVQGTRQQIDREAYRLNSMKVLQENKFLTVVEGL